MQHNAQGMVEQALDALGSCDFAWVEHLCKQLKSVRKDKLWAEFCDALAMLLHSESECVTSLSRKVHCLC